MLKTRSGQEYDKCYLGSTSAIKISALQGAFQRIRIEVEIIPLKVPSNVNEQPIGIQETFNGAVNRLTYLNISNSLRFAAENGMEFSEYGEAKDQAIVMVSNLKESLWFISKPVVLSSSIAKPAKAHTLAKPGGFINHTIGQSLVDLGFATSSDNWHEELCGVSRVQILEDAFVELIEMVLSKPNW